jgi:hypothetical protein
MEGGKGSQQARQLN